MDGQENIFIMIFFILSSSAKLLFVNKYLDQCESIKKWFSNT